MMSGKSVNVPTNEKIKEKDVNNKLQLYGIYRAFANGKAPSNKQIDVALNSALASRGLASPSKKLSPEGQHLVADLREVIEQAKILLLTKNQGNLLQDFIWQTQQLSGGNASTPNAPIGKGTAQQHGNEALEGLRTLGTLILSNGQFRKLLKDATVLLRDMAGDAAQKAANKVNPSEDELRNIDEPEQDNTWHDVPDMSRDKLRNQAKQTFDKNKPFNKEQARDALGDATQAAHPSGSRDPRDAADLAARDQQRGTNSGVDAASGAQAGAEKLKAQAKQNVPEEQQERLRNTKDRSANYLKEKLPEERRDQTIYRLKKMIVEIQGHQDYQQAIDTLLRLAEEYSGHTRNIAGQTGGAVKGAHADDSLQTAEADLKTLIERFANSTSLDDLFDSINVIYRDADNDPELKSWFRHMNRYIRKCLKEQGFVLQDSATDEWNQLYDQGNFLFRERYRNHTDRIADELKFYADQFDQDARNTAFGNSLTKLFNDLGTDDQGKASFKPHLVKDLTEVIIPGIFESVRYVPIPRIEYSDPMIDAVVENLVLEGDNLAPNVMEFGSDNYWRWGRKSISNKNKNKVMLSVSGIQCDLRDVSYYIKKKEGFPSITDKGVMDIFMGGSGLSFKVAMQTADKSDGQHFFKVDTVHVEMANLNIKLKQSNHKLLFKMFKPLLLKVMRPVIQKVIEKQIRDNVHQLDAIAYSINKEAESAKQQALNNPDPENIQNIYQRYASAGQKYMTKTKQKKENAKESMEDKQFNVAVTQHDSIFKNLALPGGISTKATEYRDLAAKGDKWESPIFSIGSARETSNLPHVASISRKPHTVNTEGVVGKNAPNSQSNYGNDGTSGYGSGSSSTGHHGSGLTGQGQGQGLGQSQTGYGSGATGYGTEQGYGTSGTQQGYGTSAQQGYGTSGTQQGYGTSGTQQGYGTSGTQQGYGTSGTEQGYGSAAGLAHRGVEGHSGQAPGTFGNEVDSAFNQAQQIKPANGGETSGTLLGKNNPVWSGNA